MFRMSGISQDFEEMLVSPGTSAILGRAVALPGDAGRIGIRIVCRPSFLDHDRMFPVIAEVVGVGKAGDARFEQAVQRQAILVGDIIDGAPIAILPTALAAMKAGGCSMARMT